MKKLLAIFAVVMLVAFAVPAFAATNPFMDVPAGHWAYDAVAQLASRGVASGYPDGSYKGAQPATRYEMASMVARVLANVDMDKASKQDVELLKRLVLEFKNELDALGVKVSDLDKRVAVLEDGIGGWKVRGIFRFDAKFGSSDNSDLKGVTGYMYTDGKKNQFTKERFRLFLTKTLDENSYFYGEYRVGSGGKAGQGDAGSGYWSHLFVDTKLPWSIDFRVGRFAVDFEDDYGLYIDNDAIFGDFRIDGFKMKKDFGALSLTGIIGRNSDFAPVILSNDVEYDSHSDYMTYIVNLHFAPSEKFFIGGLAYWMDDDSAVYGGTAYVSGDTATGDIKTYGGYAGYNITPAIAVKGAYYYQKLDKRAVDYLNTLPGTPTNVDDSANSWKVILDIKQEALKFTSLWVEYSREENNFYGINDRYALGDGKYDYVAYNRPVNNKKSDYIFVYAKQQWNDKLSTFARYAHADFDTIGLADADEWGAGIGYQYTPAIYFELAYVQVDHGDNNRRYWPTSAPATTANPYLDGKESVVRFRTTVTF